MASRPGPTSSLSADRRLQARSGQHRQRRPRREEPADQRHQLIAANGRPTGARATPEPSGGRSVSPARSGAGRQPGRPRRTHQDDQEHRERRRARGRRRPRPMRLSSPAVPASDLAKATGVPALPGAAAGDPASLEDGCRRGIRAGATGLNPGGSVPGGGVGSAEPLGGRSRALPPRRPPRDRAGDCRLAVVGYVPGASNTCPNASVDPSVPLSSSEPVVAGDGVGDAVAFVHVTGSPTTTVSSTGSNARSAIETSWSSARADTAPVPSEAAIARAPSRQRARDAAAHGVGRRGSGHRRSVAMRPAAHYAQDHD